MSVGGDAARFWRLTPRLYQIEMAGHHARIERGFRAREWAVWHGAALARVEKLPKYKDFCRRVNAPAPAAQSRDVLQVMCDALAAVWGAKEAE